MIWTYLRFRLYYRNALLLALLSQNYEVDTLSTLYLTVSDIDYFNMTKLTERVIRYVLMNGRTDRPFYV